MDGEKDQGKGHREGSLMKRRIRMERKIGDGEKDQMWRKE